MEPIAWHIVLRSEDGRALVPTARERRLFSSVVGRYAEEYRIPAFNCLRDHGHVVAACSRDRAGCLARALKNALRPRLAVPAPFAPIDPAPIGDRVHLLKTIHYVLGQAERHDVHDDPLHEASALPDLLGYRVSHPNAVGLLRDIAPSLRLQDFARHLGALRLLAGSDLRHLLEATSGAIGAHALQPRSTYLVEARRAAIQVGHQLQATTEQIARLLGISRSRIRMLRSRGTADRRCVQAILFQIGLREQVGHRPAR